MLNLLKEFRKLYGPWVKAAPPRAKLRPSAKPWLEILERRDCPSTTWTPQLVGGVYDTNGNNPANYNNGLPSATNPLILDGGKTSTNEPIIFGSALPIKSITVENGYQNVLTMNKGATLTTTDNDTVNGGCTLTIVSADSTGIELSGGNTFDVLAGGYLNLQDPNRATTGGTFITANDSTEYLNNAGTVTWTGTAVPVGNNAIVDTLYLAVLNTGAFNADGGINGNFTLLPGKLDLSGGVTATKNWTFYNNGGSVSLTNGAYVAPYYGYLQEGAGSSLTSGPTGGGASSKPCVLDTTASGNNAYNDIVIDGGSVTVDNVANSVGVLKFDAQTVEINGQINVDGLTTGGKSTRSDDLDCSGATVKLESNSFLNVGTTGTGALGTGNRWYVMEYASYTGSWGKPPKVPPTMSASTGATDVLVSN